MMVKMTKKQYETLVSYIKNNKRLYRSLSECYKSTPIIMAIVFLITGLYTAFFLPDKLIRFLLIPLFTFCAVSLIRRVINRERPYDRFNIPPVFEYQSGKGKSFPSRHTASAVIIAMACLYINITIGILMSVLAIIVGMVRVLTGMHYVTDVIGAIVMAFLVGMLGFWLI